MEINYATVAAMTPECRGLRDERDERWLGLVAIPKVASFVTWPARAPSYRRGWTFALPEDAHFGVVAFNRRGGEPAVAVVMDEPPERHVVGWFAAEREAEARAAVDLLNAEIRALWQHWRSVQAAPAAGSPLPTATVLRFEEGHEYAPDARWGLQIVTLADDGRYTYEQRRRGSVVRTGAGDVGRARVQAVLADLARSSFPEVPDRPWPPGATMLTIATAPDRSATINRWHGDELDGYRESINALLAITDEAREASLAAGSSRP